MGLRIRGLGFTGLGCLACGRVCLAFCGLVASKGLALGGLAFCGLVASKGLALGGLAFWGLVASKGLALGGLVFWRLVASKGLALGGLAFWRLVAFKGLAGLAFWRAFVLLGLGTRVPNRVRQSLGARRKPLAWGVWQGGELRLGARLGGVPGGAT